MTVPLIAVTPGDITGIGPEILAKVIIQDMLDNCRLLVVGDVQVMHSSFSALGTSFNLPMIKNLEEIEQCKEKVAILDSAQGDVQLLAAGYPDHRAGEIAAKDLVQAIGLAVANKVDGLVYSPLCKETLHIGDKYYHDEYYLFQELLNNQNMKILSKVDNIFRVSITGHVPHREVADLITKQRVLNGIELLREAILLYGLESPHIAVAALNPHGGEGGLIGREEIEQITPAIQEAVSRGINVSGPIPAETIFMRAFRGEFDGVVSLYHDQANIAQKTAKFGCSVAFYVRGQIPITTPGHGFALDIAGKGIADPNNLKLAIELASHLATIKKIKEDY